MTIAEVCKAIESVDAEILLAALLQKERAWLLAHPEYILKHAEEKVMRVWLCKYAEGMPVAYIRGWQLFYGRKFVVSQDVLIPRPSTETLVEHALSMLCDAREGVQKADEGIVTYARVFRPMTPSYVLDVGTGSGCIAITLASERQSLRCIATDISAAALRVAQENAERFSVKNRIVFHEGNLLEPVQGFTEPFLLVSNPPYIASTTMLDSSVMDFEPHKALFAGTQGTDVLLPLVSSALRHPFCMGIVFECCEQQVGTLEAIVNTRPI
jgi:release factor glutamine methyltransferase